MVFEAPGKCVEHSGIFLMYSFLNELSVWIWKLYLMID